MTVFFLEIRPLSKEAQQYGKSFLEQLPERTWRWPLTKQRSDIELLMAKSSRGNSQGSKVDKLEDIGRSMILEEGDVWPCNLSRDGIAILHGASLARDSKSKSGVYHSFKIRSKLAECAHLAQLCRMVQPTAESLLRRAILERKNENFNASAVYLDRAEQMLNKIDQRGRLTDIETQFKIVRQRGKLLAAQGQNYDACYLVGTKVSEHLAYDETRFNMAEDEQVAKALLDMVSWLEADWAQLGPQLEALYRGGDTNDFCKALIALVQAEKNMKAKTLVRSSLLDEAQQETVLGCIINLASAKSPSNAKSCGKLASFCYKWGSRVIDRAIANGKVSLTTHEEEQIYGYLKQIQWGSEEELQYQMQLASELISTTQLIEYNQDELEGHIPILQQEEQVTVKLYNALPWLYQYSSITAGLLQIWRVVSNRLFELYSNSARAYFEVLRLSGEDINASLRLLRLLARHSGGLRHVLEDGFRSSSVSAWLEIVPQLFSRLHHPEPYVRAAITQLLERVASERPDDVVFAVVVASNKTDARIEASLRDFNQNDELKESKVNDQADSLEKIKSKLSKTVVADVELVVRELRRITLLWDELWLGSLNQHYADIQKRLVSLNEEAKRLSANQNISHDQKTKMMSDQQKAVMKPVITAFQHLAQITSAKPETPHEEKFQRRYGKLIQEALNRSGVQNHIKFTYFYAF